MKLWVLVIASLISTGDAAAQSTSPQLVFGRYQQTNWDERNGLPQNTVLAIAETRDGYLWVGTQEGAARFDGVRFTPFTRSNTAEIPDSLITALLETRDGDLWLATFGGGLSRYARGRFTVYTRRDGLPTEFIKCLVEDARGTLWIGTDGGGVVSLRDGRFTQYAEEHGLPGNLVRTMASDRDGSLLAGTDQGVARIANGRITRWRPDAPFARADITALKGHSDGSVWVAGGRRLYRVQPGGDVTTFDARHGFPEATAESIAIDAEGTVWVGTMTAGLFRYVAGRFEHYGRADGLPGTGRIAAFLQASGQGMWLGTDGGLVRLNPPRVGVHTRRDGLPSDFIGSIVQDADGGAWVWTLGGLARMQNGTVRTFTSRDGLPDHRPGGLARGADGFPLVYTRRGLVRWTPHGFVAIAADASVPWHRVTAVIEDRRGGLWIGIDGGGVMRLHDGQLTRLRPQDGLADDSVLTLYEDRQGHIWVGTSRNGITRISPEGLTSWSAGDGLASNHVKTFHEDTSGALWIGTHGGGLSRFKDGRFASISSRQGLHNDSVFRILEDADGSLWMNCNRGIWRNSLEQLNEVAEGRRTAVESYAYGVADGMLSSEGVGANLAGWRMRDGSLWFATTRGIAVIDPRRDGRHPPPRVLIEGATADRQPMAIDRGEIRLRPGQEHLEIQYTGLSWHRPHAIRFRFRLEGLDHDWVDAGTRRTAYFPFLPPGSYRFRVMATYGNGVWSDSGGRLGILVLPRFHQTWWFWTMAGASALALLCVVWRYRIAQLQRAQAAHQAFSRQLIASQERERQRVAAELHDSLGQNLLVVKHRAMLGALAQPQGEALRHFQEIGTTVAETLEEVRAISYNLRPHHLDQLGLTTAIRAMVDRIAESSAIAVRSTIDDIDVVFPPGEDITIYRIIQESLNNIVKHSGARDAHVMVRCREDRVDVVIRDNGRGFTAGRVAADASQNGGFGLKGLAQRVEMLGGKYTIDSVPGQGTTVQVRIGLGVRRQEREHGR